MTGKSLRPACRRLPALGLALAALLGLAACAGGAGTGSGTATPLHRASPAELASDPIRVYDPFEPVNRGIYSFNASFDRFVYLPALNIYQTVTPNFVEDRVSAFFNNLTEFRNGLNGALQLRREVAGTAIYRLFVNSTLGVFGLFDVATPLGHPAAPEDFGQTLGYWGSPPGPYLVLPVLGPSNLRDTTGFAVDTGVTGMLPPASTVNDSVFFNPAVYVLYVLDQRKQTGFRYHATGSPFEYELVRYLYTQARAFQIRG